MKDRKNIKYTEAPALEHRTVRLAHSHAQLHDYHSAVVNPKNCNINGIELLSVSNSI